MIFRRDLKVNGKRERMNFFYMSHHTKDNKVLCFHFMDISKRLRGIVVVVSLFLFVQEMLT